MTHPTPTPESLADTLAALARIKAVDADAPGLHPSDRSIIHAVVNGLQYAGRVGAYESALAHLLDVCMGVMGWVLEKHGFVCVLRPKQQDGMYPGWSWMIRDAAGKPVAEGVEPTHLSAACAVVRAIADSLEASRIAGVVGEKEGATDE